MIWGEVLDQIDRKILRHLQRDASGTTAELADDVGLSLSACAKRVARLKNDGTISAVTAKLDPKKFPKPVSAAVMVTLSAPKADVSDRFARAMAKIDDVQQCHVVTGDFDFLLIIKAPSIEEYHEFAQSVLGTSTDVQSYKTTFILKTIKNADTIPEFCISAAGA